MGVEFALQLDNVFQNIDEIWMIARRKKELLEVAQHLEHTTRILDMDITKEEQIERLRKLLADEKPVVRMLVNCAGYGILGDFTASNISEELGMIEVNCKALTQMTHLCLPYMKKNSRIIQLASSAAFLPQPNFAVYAATKAYVYSFSRALRQELRRKKIYVTAVCPGPVDTPFFDIAHDDGHGRDGDAHVHVHVHDGVHALVLEPAFLSHEPMWRRWRHPRNRTCRYL